MWKQEACKQVKSHGKIQTYTRDFRSMLCCRRWNSLVFPSVPLLFNPLGDSRYNNIKIE